MAKSIKKGFNTIHLLIAAIVIVAIIGFSYKIISSQSSTSQIAADEITRTNGRQVVGGRPTQVTYTCEGASAYKVVSQQDGASATERIVDCPNGLSCKQESQGITCAQAASAPPATSAPQQQAPPPASSTVAPPSSKVTNFENKTIVAQGRSTTQTYTCDPESGGGSSYKISTKAGTSVPQTTTKRCTGYGICQPTGNGIQCVEGATPETSQEGSKCTTYSDKFQICSDYLTVDQEVNDRMPFVRVKFTDLPTKIDGKEFYYCLKGSAKDCVKDDWEKTTESALQEGLTVCGDGGTSLKTKCDDNGYDWFHVGKTYWVFVAQGKSNELAASDIMTSAPIPIYHYYPEVVSPLENPNVPTLNIDSVKANPDAFPAIILQGRNPKGGESVRAGRLNINSNQYNDYWIEVFAHDTDYKTPGKCLYVPSSSNPGAAQGKQTIQLPSEVENTAGKMIPLQPGSYVLRIKEGADGNFEADPTKTDCKDNGFTLYDIPFSIGGTGENEKGEKVSAGGIIGPAIRDPYGKEGGTGWQIAYLTPPEVCGQKDSRTGYCLSVNTALGPISTEPGAFMRDLFRIVLAIGGIAVVVFFVQAGYTLINSAGSKEKVGQAREQITAAIMGLIFIILSIAILEFIGVRILQLPGFS